MSSTPARTNIVFLVVMGALILAGSGWVFLLILKNVYGRYELSDLIPTERNIRTVVFNEAPKVAVLSSRYSSSLRGEGSSWLQGNLAAWEHFLQSRGLHYDVVDDSTVERGGLETFSMLVLPGANALSDGEVRQIKKYIDGGGSVFATSGTGSYTEDGVWRGWDFLSEVFGLQFTREITPEEPLKLHTLRGGLPITADIPSGFALKVATWDRPIACEVVEPRTTQVSFWYNFVSDSGLVSEGVEKTAGIAYGSYGHGRFVWMGFELNSVLGEQRDYVYFDILCRHSVDWLTSSPTIRVKDWPSSYAAAALLAASLSKHAGNVANLLPLVREENIPMTFFVDPVAVAADSSLISGLRSYGEIAALVPLGPVVSSADIAARWYDQETQTGNARKVMSEVQNLAGATVHGALPSSGQYNDASFHALLASGYSYVASDSLTDRSVPETIIKGEHALVAFTKTARGDREVVGEFGLTSKGFQLFTYKEDVDRVLFQGGVYFSLFHADLQCRPENVLVVRDLARYLRSKNVWLATASEIQQWWLVRNSLEVSAHALSSRRVAILISNPSDDVVQNAVVQVFLNRRVERVAMTSDIISTPIPVYGFDPKTQQVDIRVPPLGSGKSLSYFIDYDLIGS